MIPKGNQRAGGQQLATHLLNEYDNDRVETVEVRGAVAKDLHGAFAEWYAEAKGTRCKKYLYSLSINPDHRQGPFSRDHYYDFIARSENALGLTDQPRAVVFHVKHGREHCHVVWSRIDTGKMKAVHIDHDHQKLRSVAQDFARDHGITLPLAMQKNGVRDRFNDRAKRENLAEKQQEERSGISKEEHRRVITEAWRESTDAGSLVRALEQRGYYLARGDQRAYVVVDIYGEIHSLSRQLDGVKAKELMSRLSTYNLDRLPDAAAAQDFARRQAQARLKEAARQPERSSGRPLNEVFQENAVRKRAGLEEMQKRRRDELEKKRQAVIARHHEETAALRQMQKEEAAGIEAGRRQRQPQGLVAFLSRITGIRAIADYRQRRQDFERAREHRRQRSALARRHRSEMTDFRYHDHALTRVEKREARSLRTELRREEFRAIATPAREQKTAQKERALRENSKDITAPPLKQPEPTKDSLADKFRKLVGRGKEKPTPEQIRENAADITTPPAKEPTRTKDSLADTFRKSAEPERTTQTPAPEQIRENAGDITTPPAPQKQPEADRQSLKEAFRRRAARKRRDDERERDDRHHHRPAPDPFRFPGRY